MKVFCIGFHKTGTTTLGAALTVLGYRVKGHFGVHDPNIAKTVYRKARKYLSRYDGFEDNPWPVLYRFLDESCPGSKFILTTRDTDQWIASQVRHFGDHFSHMRNWIYGAGSPLGNEELYVERYAQHNADVLEYFQDRPADLLVLDLASGEGWQSLCAFLDAPIPETPFPHANRATDRERPQSILQKARRLKRRWMRRIRDRFG